MWVLLGTNAEVLRGMRFIFLLCMLSSAINVHFIPDSAALCKRKVALRAGLEVKMHENKGFHANADPVPTWVSMVSMVFTTFPSPMKFLGGGTPMKKVHHPGEIPKIDRYHRHPPAD